MLVIKNGTLISMAGIYKEKYDVAVENGKIAKVEKEICELLSCPCQEQKPC